MWRAACLVTLGVCAACSSSATVTSLHLCGRGDRVALSGGFTIEFLDEGGAPVLVTTASQDSETRIDGPIPPEAITISVIGLGADSQPLAQGTATIDPESDDQCVCVALDRQHLAACAGIGCRFEGGQCVFLDEDSGGVAGERTLVFGENDGDTPTEVFDTLLDGEAQGENNGASLDLQLDPLATALFRFDLGGLPTSSTIVDATLHLTVADDDSLQLHELSRVLEAWDESTGDGTPGCANWTCRTATDDWSNAGCGTPISRDATPVLSTTALTPVETTVALQSTALTELVQDWVEDSSGNHGVSLTNAEASGSLTLHSSESTDGSRPRLEVTFVVGR